MSEEKSSPFKIPVPLIAAGISAGSSLLGGIISSRQARRAQRAAEAKERESRAEMNRMKQIYSDLDTSNPYLNMENTMEDLTINQKQAQFEAQQFQQSQANILDSMRGAAGGSGIASVAQALAQQGQLAAQRSAASIGAQESANQRLKQQEAGRLQTLERRGELISRDLERNKVTTLLGMAQGETAAYGQRAAMAQQARFDAIGSAFSGVAQAGITGLQAGAFDGLGGGGRVSTATSDMIQSGGGDGGTLTPFGQAFKTHRQQMVNQFGMDYSKWQNFNWNNQPFHPYTEEDVTSGAQIKR